LKLDALECTCHGLFSKGQVKACAKTGLEVSKSKTDNTICKKSAFLGGRQLKFVKRERERERSSINQNSFYILKSTVNTLGSVLPLSQKIYFSVEKVWKNSKIYSNQKLLSIELNICDLFNGLK
jgi:hypothetical protein